MFRSFHSKEDDVLHSGPFQLEAGGSLVPADQGPDAAIAVGFPSHDGLREEAVQLFGTVGEDAVGLQQLVLLVAEQQLSLVEEGDLVA